MTPVAADPARPSERFLERIPHRFAREHLVLSGGHDAGTERLLVGPQTPAWIPHNIGTELGCAIETEQTDPERLAAEIDRVYEARQAAEQRAEADPYAKHESRVPDDADRDLLSLASKGDAARFVDSVLFEALARGASDVHVQPTVEGSLVRVRVDGVLQVLHRVPVEATASITSRIKVLADLDIAERRLAQDGRATVTIGRRSDRARAVDLRISTLPTRHGERVVVRLLDNERDEGLQRFAALGMPAGVEETLKGLARRSHGLTLVTGPTGSGKSTTLYATLRWIAAKRSSLNIMTIEDPIECDLSAAEIAVSQSQVSSKKGVTFASGLRHILRQDPDVIMIGEIRDEETARIAVQASLTGHLVFSTLHTNDAPSAVTRLIDLSVEPYLVGSSLSAVLAQRLVRVLHPACKGEGCEACLRTGFKGRTGLYELLPIDDEIRELIARGDGHAAIRAAAESKGMRSLRDHGEQLIEARRTVRSEVDRVVSGV